MLKNGLKKLFTVGKCLLSMILTVFILMKVDWGKAWSILSHSDFKFFLLVFLLHSFSFLLSSYKWLILLREQNISRKLADLWMIYYIGFFFNNFLPTSVGGDVVRIVKTSRSKEEISGVGASIIAERLVGLLALLVLAFVGYFSGLKSGFNFYLGNSGLYILLFTGVGFLIVWFAVAIAKKDFQKYRMLAVFIEKIKQVRTQIFLYREKQATLLKALGFSFVFYFIMVLNIYFIAKGIGVSIDIFKLVFIVPTVALISMIPITFNGLGVREAAYVIFFQQIGISIESGVLIAFTSRMYSVIGSLIGATLHIFEDTAIPFRKNSHRLKL